MHLPAGTVLVEFGDDTFVGVETHAAAVEKARTSVPGYVELTAAVSKVHV